MIENLPTIQDVDVAGRRVLLRLDLNMPVSGGVVQKNFRIQKTLPTINLLRENGAKEITIISHHSDTTQTLQPIARALNEHIPAMFVGDIFSEESQAEIRAAEAHTGSSFVRVAENLRMWEGEENNDSVFARKLASLGDIYVNEAFSGSHREHASIVGVPEYLPSAVGPLFESEVQNLSEAFHPDHPFVFVLGGAKPETKIPLIRRFAEKADALFVSGAVAHGFYKALGYEIGTSRLDDSGSESELRDIVESGGVLLPQSVVVRNEEGVFEKDIQDVSRGDSILDASPRAIERLRGIVKDARFVLWNGPLGDYLTPGFERGTVAFAKILAELKTARRIIGGGDTLAVVSNLALENEFDFVSTGGGAMLTFLADGTLPGIEAIANNQDTPNTKAELGTGQARNKKQ